MSRDTDSEARWHGEILNQLRRLGWDKRPCNKGGQVYTQNELRKNHNLKDALGLEAPENIVALDSVEHWVIEAKSDIRNLSTALSEARDYAEKINSNELLSCRIITGIAGSPDDAFNVETRCLINQEWVVLTINDRVATGFITPLQMRDALEKGRLYDYDIDDDLFNRRTETINNILHQGAINKRNRAGALACVLLALTEDQTFRLSDNATTLIADINSRARSTLENYGKQNFFDQIKITLPPSKENHEKHRKALSQVIEILRSLNIASTINSGRDMLGQFYEQFLRYANDAKEIGIVLTPRHITRWAVETIGVSPTDIVFDPACGTGGFLVSALDLVRDKNQEFNPGNLHGIEQDAMVATLALVNMIFRGDGSSNIIESNSLVTHIPIQPNKVFMNPPFALDFEYEWKFVDRALGVMKEGGILFAIVPTTTMMSETDGRKELTWRKEMLRRHRLIAVIKLPEQLFKHAKVSKGTYGIVLEAHRPHVVENDKVLFGFMNDGIAYSKTQKDSLGNMDFFKQALGNYLATRTEPQYVAKQIDCRLLQPNDFDLSPEKNIGGNDQDLLEIDLGFVEENLERAMSLISRKQQRTTFDNYKRYLLISFFSDFEKGKSGRNINLPPGDLPLISTSESQNGIMSFVDRDSVSKVYSAGIVTISSNGGSCCAFYHDYETAVNGDVFVCNLKEAYNSKEIGIYLCAAINNEKWRFNYYRKFNLVQLNKLRISLPVNQLNPLKGLIS